MATTTTLRLATAVEYVRQGRHSADCTCGLYRDHNRAPYCSAEEFRWSEMLNKILISALDEQRSSSSKQASADMPQIYGPRVSVSEQPTESPEP